MTSIKLIVSMHNASTPSGTEYAMVVAIADDLLSSSGPKKPSVVEADRVVL